MKFTKTEQTLLDEAKRSPYGLVGTDHGVQARRAFGMRRSAAARSLRDKGLLVRVHSDKANLYKHGYGINGIVYSSTWQLTSVVATEQLPEEQ